MRRVARTALVLGTAATVLGLAKAHAVSNGYDFTESSRFAWSLAYVTLLAVCSYGAGLPDLARSRRAAIVAALGASLAASVAIAVAQLVAGSAQLPRAVVFGVPLVLVPFYVLCSAMAQDARNRDGQRDRVIVVASLLERTHLADELAANPERSAVVVAALAPAEASSAHSGGQPLVDAALASSVTAVVLDREAQADESVVAQAAVLHEAGIRIRTLSLFYDEWLGKLPVSELERVALMFDIGELHRARYGRMKRMMDGGLAVAGLVVLVAVLPIVALGNLVGNRGPLLFRQDRVGKGGRVFQMVKFRTMRPGAGGGVPADWTGACDPRVTPFGAWLRRSHLDELPQVLNILRGHLSVVGPRPEQPHYVAELERKIAFYRLRHLVRPGLTGWAQVKYPYGANESDAIEKLQYEFYYLRHQGIGLDLRIVGRTVRAVIGRGGR